MYFSPGFTHGKVKGIYKDDKTFSSLKHRRENYQDQTEEIVHLERKCPHLLLWKQTR